MTSSYSPTTTLRPRWPRPVTLWQWPRRQVGSDLVMPASSRRPLPVLLMLSSFSQRVSPSSTALLLSFVLFCVRNVIDEMGRERERQTSRARQTDKLGGRQIDIDTQVRREKEKRWREKKKNTQNNDRREKKIPKRENVVKKAARGEKKIVETGGHVYRREREVLKISVAPAFPQDDSWYRAFCLFTVSCCVFREFLWNSFLFS